MLYGNFLPGETIVSEEGGVLRIPNENTISHFVVTRQGTGYTEGSRISVNGIQFEKKDVEVGINGGTVYKVEINNRNVLQTDYGKPPQIEIEGSSTIGAVVTPVLYRNTVLTFTAQNVKSLFSEFGSSSKFTADIETGEAFIKQNR